jgi:hypothetical protein
MNKTIGKETVIEVGGKKYVISRFERHIADSFLTFVRKVTPDPLDLVREKLKGFPEAIQHRMIDKAMEKAARPIGYGSPEYQAVLSTPEGSYHLLYLLLKKHHPELSEKDVIALYDQSVAEHGFGYIERLMSEAEGTLPTNEADVKRQTLEGFGLIEAEPEKKG